MDFSLDAYHAWCDRQDRDFLLADEERGGEPDERLMQYIWQHQRIHRDALQTVDGRRCEVLHPGFWNRGSGPDFTQALIRLDGGMLLSGDVEIDRAAAGWRAHGHDRNPSFENVVLRVVWFPPRELSSSIPLLALEPSVDGSPCEMSSGFATDSFALPVEFLGKCQVPLSGLSTEQVQGVLRAVAKSRFRQKAEQLQLRACDLGWHLALWEGLVAGLGYSKNTWPMRRIGELTPRLFKGFPSEPLCFWSSPEVEARLFGVAGFLPEDSSSLQQAHVARLWDVWWRIRDEFSDVIFPNAMWHFAGLRPHNHPHRRLALVAHWIQRLDFFPRLDGWFMEAAPDESLELLMNALTVEAAPFWSKRFHFRRSSSGVSPLMIGHSRAIDLAVNVILPWFWSRAQAEQNEALMQRAEQLFYSFPRSEENRLLKDGCRRLLGREDLKVLVTAADQQGLLQILRDFCAHSNAVCDRCRFPDLIRSLGVAYAMSNERDAEFCLPQ
ncbi:MAG: hypothetical protein M2R45_02494 [Verrucomicrobia subdivision 3 bacterium]|nr:hypothetical protein [Limisphaerales bacterium]MCS1413284.1 hypothetical protein [Limisphaerales bacterium]